MNIDPKVIELATQLNEKLEIIMPCIILYNINLLGFGLAEFV